MSNFRVGEKVVCVDADENWFLTQDAIYTIVGILPGNFRQCDGLHLAEIAHPSGLAFYASRFRPIVERKTDTGMAILQKLLQPKTEEVT